MQVDLTEAAKFYGLRNVPPVVWDALDPHNAAYDYTSRAIHIDPEFFKQEFTDEYSEKRFTRAGAGKLDSEDAKRFIVAHELWHARQYELDVDAVHRDKVRMDAQANAVYQNAYIDSMLGLLTDEEESKVDAELDRIHDQDPVERSADKHAAQAYKLVKFDAAS